ncbi:protein FAM228B isoform X2 [Cyanistes caeruleus]|uniref:Family with sequence similarity 228 member B n=1 Tax=Cyanistes caeruleus TaxID=156563 RepID=A0A8C0TZC0_CYACU|nr:protein FAM228B isoform X2 [Cyanistes caeruleus]
MTKTNPTMDSVNSSEGPWLQRFANGKPLRKPKRQQPWKAAPDQSQDIIASVQCLLDRENFVREVDRYLRHCDFLDLRKTELLYKKYLEDVSEPFMQKMKDQMHSQSEEEVQKRRREQFSQYLNYCAKKGYVFLDHYDPAEYDPFFQKTCRDCWKDESHQLAQ